MSSSEMDEDDSSVDLNDYNQSPDDDDDFPFTNYVDSSDNDDGIEFASPVPSQTTSNGFLWKKNLKQRFTELFQGKLSDEAVYFVEGFALRHSLNDILVDDLLVLLKLLHGKALCSNCSHPCSSGQAVVLSKETPPPSLKKTFPDSTISDVCIESKISVIQDTSPDIICKKEELQSADLSPSEDLKTETAKSRVIPLKSVPEDSSIEGTAPDIICQKEELHCIVVPPSENIKIEKAKSRAIPLLSVQEDSSDSRNIPMKTSNERTVDTSSFANILLKRKLKYNEEPPVKRMTFETVMEERENGHMYCKTCEITCTSEKSARDHFIGKSHAKNLENKKRSAVPPPTKLHVQGNAVGNINSIHCQVCNKYISGEDNAKAHYAGKVHKKNMDRQKTLLTTLSEIVPSTSFASASKVLNALDLSGNVSEVKIGNSILVTKNPSSSRLPNDINEIGTISDVTKRLRELYMKRQKELNNELNSDSE